MYRLHRCCAASSTSHVCAGAYHSQPRLSQFGHVPVRHVLAAYQHSHHFPRRTRHVLSSALPPIFTRERHSAATRHLGRSCGCISRHLHSGLFSQPLASRHQRYVAMSLFPTPATPNQALQRTAPAVTLAASSLRLSPTAQPSRQPPPSLSLGSFGARTEKLSHPFWSLPSVPMIGETPAFPLLE